VGIQVTTLNKEEHLSIQVGIQLPREFGLELGYSNGLDTMILGNWVEIYFATRPYKSYSSKGRAPLL
jgi:hypothetical protein